jgi:hypothetical protein
MCRHVADADACGGEFSVERTPEAARAADLSCDSRMFRANELRTIMHELGWQDQRGLGCFSLKSSNIHIIELNHLKNENTVGIPWQIIAHLK